MTNATTNVARVAAAVAGFGLVAMSFAPLAGAQTTTTTTSATFTRDLTIGSTGADVTALQNWLISKGYSIPAGATGYFGAQTKAAVAAYQAANKITPAAGYFGPITRASVASMGGSTGGSTGGNGGSTGGLSGGEADLRNFDLLAEDGEGSEGESEVEAATAEFDVDGGDVRVERAELTVHATNGSLGDRPWDYIDNVSVWADGKKLGDMDSDSRSDWDEEDSDDFSGGSDSQYTITLDDLDYVVEDGDTADLTFAFDINDNIDTADLAQSFDVAVLDDGIRAIDAKGIQQYTGDDNDNVNFDFSEEDNGDLSVRESSDNPDNGILAIDDNDTSDEYDVLIGEFRNSGDADSLVTDMTFTVATSSGVTDQLSDVLRRATLDIDGDTFRGDINDDGTIEFDDLDVQVDADDTLEFTLSAEFAPTSAGLANGDQFSFNITGSTGVEAEGVDSGDDTDVDGSISGSTFTLSESGIEVEGTSNSSTVTTLDTVDASTGTYTIRFDVTAGDDDLYIPAAASSTASSSVGVKFDPSAAASFSGTTSPVLTSSADSTGTGYSKYYIVRAGDSESFTVTVTLNPSTAGNYEVDVTDVYFDTDTNASTALTDFDVSDNDDFRTDPVYIPS